MSMIDPNTRKLAEIVYGEGSTANNKNEMSAIAFAFANRARAWGGKTIAEILAADPQYTFVVKDGNPRYNAIKNCTESQIEKDAGMSLALNCAINALKRRGHDPSNGAFWWDGKDFKINYDTHPKVIDGFRFGDPSHNIFNVNERHVSITQYWRVKNKKTGKIVDSKIRGTYTAIWVSTAAYGKTILWAYDQDYLKATGGKYYR